MQVLENIQKTLKRNLKRLRSEQHLTQDQLAEAAGFSLGYIGNLETGKVWTSPEGIRKIAEALHCSEEDLFRPESFEITPKQALDALAFFVESHEDLRVSRIPAVVMSSLRSVDWDDELEMLVEAAIKGTLEGDLISREKQVKHRKKRA